jgi:DNA/RNA endonuclease G (NUC1)
MRGHLRALTLCVLVCAKSAVADKPIMLNFVYTPASPEIVDDKDINFKSQFVWSSANGVGAECASRMFGRDSVTELPSFSNSKAYCTTAARKGSSVAPVEVYASYMSTVTKVPKYVFFRLPPAGSDATARSDVWPDVAVSPELKPWGPNNKCVSDDPMKTGAFVENPSFHVQSRGHMASNSVFTNSAIMQYATFSFSNVFPTFNSIHGVSNQRPFDGEVWNAREVATRKYADALFASTSVAEQLYVVVGTSTNGALAKLTLTATKSTAADQLKPEDVVDVPAAAFTAVYDSVNKRGLAWLCRQFSDNRVFDATANVGSTVPPCKYVSIDKLQKSFKTPVDLFPGADANALKMFTPEAFDPNNWAKGEWTTKAHQVDGPKVPGPVTNGKGEIVPGRTKLVDGPKIDVPAGQIYKNGVFFWY